MAVFEGAAPSSLETRVAALEALLQSVIGTVDTNAGAADAAIGDESEMRSEQIGSQVLSLQSEQSARIAADQANADRIGDQITAHTVLSEQVTGIDAALGDVRVTADAALAAVPDAIDAAAYAEAQGDYAKAQGSAIGDISSSVAIVVQAKTDAQTAATSVQGSAADIADTKSRTKNVKAPSSPLRALWQLEDNFGYRWLYVTPTLFRHPVIDGVQATVSGLTANVGNISRPAAPEPMFQQTDTNGRRWFYVTPTKLKHPVIDNIVVNFATFQASVGNIKVKPAPVSTFELTDNTSYRYCKITPTEFRHPVIDRLVAGTPAAVSLATLAEVQHFAIFGQSLALALRSTPPISTTPLSYALMAKDGVRGVDWSALAGLAETATDGSGAGETVASGCAMMLRQLMLADTGIDIATLNRKLLFTANGKYDTEIAALGQGSVPFGQMTAGITSAKAAVSATSRSYAPQAMLYLQGERDYALGTPVPDWLTMVRQMRRDLETFVRTAVGLAALTLPMVTYQTASHLYYGVTTPGIALAQLTLASDPNIAFAAPTYFLPFYTDGVHLTAAGEQWLGAYFAIALHSWIGKGIKLAPLVPDRITVLGNTILAHFPVAAGKKLTIDTSTVAAQANYGFAVVNAAGAAVSISNIHLVSRDVIAIDCASAPAAGWNLRYGWSGDTKGLGNLRDNTGDTLIFDPAGFARPMHTWVPIFSQGVL